MVVLQVPSPFGDHTGSSTGLELQVDRAIWTVSFGVSPVSTHTLAIAGITSVYHCAHLFR